MQHPSSAFKFQQAAHSHQNASCLRALDAIYHLLRNSHKALIKTVECCTIKLHVKNLQVLKNHTGSTAGVWCSQRRECYTCKSVLSFSDSNDKLQLLTLPGHKKKQTKKKLTKSTFSKPHSSSLNTCHSVFV